MNKLSMLAATAVIAAVSTTTAHADNSGAFVQAGAGRATIAGGGTGSGKFSYGVSGGYRWALSPTFALGAEGGYVDLGHRGGTFTFSQNFTDMAGPHSGTISERDRGSIKAVTLGVNAKWDMSETYFLMLRGGVARYRIQSTAMAYATFDGVSSVSGSSTSFNSTRYYAGAGFGIHLTPQLDLQVTYDHYAPRYSTYGYHFSPSLNSWAASAEYRF